MNSAIDPLFNSLKVKYEVFDRILANEEVYLTKKDTNIFIDLDSLFRSIFNHLVADIANTGHDDDYKIHVKNMVSNILNLASHYRRFFTKKRIYTRIYFLSSCPFNDLTGYNNFFIKDYRKNFNAVLREPRYAMLLKILLESFNMLKIVTDYIEDLYLITSNCMEIAIIPKVINEIVDPNTNTNFIITKDNYYYQYTSQDYIILRPKYNDQSYLVTKDNVIKRMKEEANVKTELSIDPSFFVFIKTMIGDKYRGIPKFSGVGMAKILKLLNDAVSNNLISSTGNDIYGLSRLVDKSHQDRLLNNFSVTDLDYQSKCISIGDKNIIKSQLVNKFDNIGLKEINDTLFRDNPINLKDLTNHINLKYVKKQGFNGYNVFMINKK